MKAPVIRRLRAERGGNRHLRHDGRAAAADQAAVDEENAATRARGLDRRIHAGTARSDDQDVGFDVHGLGLAAGSATGHGRHYSWSPPAVSPRGVTMASMRRRIFASMWQAWVPAPQQESRS